MLPSAVIANSVPDEEKNTDMTNSIGHNRWFKEARSHRIAHTPSQQSRADVFRYRIHEPKKVCHNGGFSACLTH